MVTEDKIKAIGNVLNDPSRPLKERFRALFTLKNLGGPVAIACIEKCFSDDSALLKHELAYCLGQMQNELAIPILVSVLRNKDQEPMVRHEAGEALGAIGSEKVINVLKEFVNDKSPEVAETCQLALARIQWKSNDKTGVSKNEELSENSFTSIDPAPPSIDKDISILESILLDSEKPLFDRYRALFSLRNLRSSESALIISKGLKAGSALFRHEVAFVLGQLQDPLTVDYLQENLSDLKENDMVRHECAEALGSIATESCIEFLKRYLNDSKQVVRESCEVALDISDYANSPEFQYADTLLLV